ncbi:MAG: AtpZ/AtpI family protein [Candidatus Omnitrophica bacterium]|nr:AtpZ/AtpI family protein [Candidatus Omnitrophota bacterium]
MTGKKPDPTPKRSKTGQAGSRSDWQAASLALSIPGLFIAGPLVGYALGWALTTYLGWPSWVLGAATILGLFSGSYESYVILKRLSKLQDKRFKKKTDDDSK